ncbi:lectin C-type domain protein [Opisthorchis viverrini]|nr:lectin C-type domain protein [Opisthorchis viverrini]
MQGVYWILWAALSISCSAWPQQFTLLTGMADFSGGLIHPLSANSYAPATGSQVTETETTDDTHVEVMHLTTASYKGLNYVMVTNLSLPFAQAEHYCAHEFSEPMHLVSVGSENEWKMLSNVFRSHPKTTKVWLGGTVERSSPNTLLVRWINGQQFGYHRFSEAERKRWRKEWKQKGQACIVAELQEGGVGNWAVELAPCSLPRSFICKEEENRDHSTGVDGTLMPFQPFRLGDLIRSLFLPSPFLPTTTTRSFTSLVRNPPAQNRVQFQAYNTQPTTQNVTQSTLTTPTTEPSTETSSTSTTTDLAVETVTNTKSSPTTTTEVTTVPTTAYSGTTGSTKSESDSVVLREGIVESVSPSSTTAELPGPVQTDNLSGPEIHPKFTIFSSTPNGVASSEHGVPLPQRKTEPQAFIPDVGAQVIYPRSPWDITYLDEPQWLTRKQS